MRTPSAVIFGHDNDTYMVASCQKRLYDVPDSVFCRACGWKVDWRYIRPDYTLGRRRRDVSATYDGTTIISRRVADMFLSFGASESDFRVLPKEPDFFALTPEAVAAFDWEARGTRREELCSECGLHATVAGATPAFLKSVPSQQSWIAHTDVLFGSYHEHHPLIIVSHDIATQLRKARFSGLDIQDVRVEP